MSVLKPHSATLVMIINYSDKYTSSKLVKAI
jgi:hypothetical protein